MAIYRGAGGAGDATQDAASEVLLALAAKDAAIAAQVAAETAQIAAETAETNAETAAAAAATFDPALYLTKAGNLSGLANTSTARTNLGLGTIATQAANNVTITGGSVSGITDLAIADGGTGASDAPTARTNLGLGTISTQAANNVSITGGSITGITDLAVADGGTGSSTASGARTNIGAAASGANSDITSLTGLTTPLSQAQGGTGTTTGYYGFKNRIINGAMVIDQRNAGAATANTINGYTLDRWVVAQSVTGKLIAQQNAGSVTPPAGFNNYLGITSQSAYSILSTDTYYIRQGIEGFNFADCNWGSANAKTITLSFWVRSSLTGTFGGSLNNSDYSRSYPFSYTISSANTWEYKTVTIAGDTSGTWVGATNGVGLNVLINLGAGSTFSGTANTWASAVYVAPTGATSVVGTNGATFYITGVQLEVGSTATSFDYRPYGTELQLCQRYYEVINSDSNQQTFWADCNGGNGVCAVANLFYRATKRATPTVTQYGTYVLLNTNSPSLVAGNNQMTIFYQTSSASRCYWYPSLNAGVTINAEL